jgi:Tudor domain
VKYVDYGDEEDANVGDIRQLPNEELILLPYQVLICSEIDITDMALAVTRSLFDCICV